MSCVACQQHDVYVVRPRALPLAKAKSPSEIVVSGNHTPCSNVFFVFLCARLARVCDVCDSVRGEC